MDAQLLKTKLFIPRNRPGWLGNLDVINKKESSSLNGEIIDQATLDGILKIIREIGLELILIGIIDL